jgi:hypothetical protein
VTVFHERWNIRRLPALLHERPTAAGPPAARCVDAARSHQAFGYRFYRLSLPADARDIIISVTRLEGLTDIIVSRTEEFPTKSRLADAQAAGGGLGKGWWITESADGGGTSIIIRNFEAGYGHSHMARPGVCMPLGTRQSVTPLSTPC